jgi:hypothetical protein
LEPVDQPRLLYERADQPSEQSPILYRERAYAVDSLQDDDSLEGQMRAELLALQSDLDDRDAPLFIQLALFDHGFDTEPSSPPIATLSWKDWQGQAEVWVRGLRKEPAPAVGEASLGETDAALSTDADLGEAETESTPPDSAPRFSPSDSGQYAVISAAAPDSDSPPSSTRGMAGEELIGALFERMHELLYLPDLGSGAQYVLNTLESYIPSDGILISVLNSADNRLVIQRALGPHAKRVLGTSQAPEELLLGDTNAEEHTQRIDGKAKAASVERFRDLGVTVDAGLLSPVRKRGRLLGAIELCRAPGTDGFSEGEVVALEYICEQFSDFVALRR